MASAKDAKKMFAKDDKSKKTKKHKIVRKTTVKQVDLKNILVGGSVALGCFKALSRFGPSAVAYGGPAAIAITVGLTAFEMWSSKQIRKSGQIISKKHSIKKKESAAEAAYRDKNTDDAIVIGQIALYLVTMLGFSSLQLAAAPAIIFGAMGIVAKLSQMGATVVEDIKGKEK